MKSYTDLKQSKKLAEILPLESADMYYISGDECDICFGKGVYEEIADWICEGIPKPADIPCWSLPALLEVLPKEYTNSKNQVCSLHIDIVDSKTPYLMWYANPEHESSIVEIKTEEYSNLVDVCYEMVIKLHELEIL